MLSRIKIHTGLLILIIFIISCKNSTVKSKSPAVDNNNSISKKDFPVWVEAKDNGLSNSKSINDFNYEIQYKPIEYILAIKGNDSLKATDYEGLHYIDLKLSNNGNPDYLKTNLSNREDYYLRLKYFSFEIQNDLKLIDGKDTLNCVFSHFERTYGITPYIKIVTAFEKNTDSSNDLFFSYHDQLFDNGIIIIPITKAAINNIPKIKI